MVEKEGPFIVLKSGHVDLLARPSGLGWAVHNETELKLNAEDLRGTMKDGSAERVREAVLAELANQINAVFGYLQLGMNELVGTSLEVLEDAVDVLVGVAGEKIGEFDGLAVGFCRDYDKVADDYKMMVERSDLAGFDLSRLDERVKVLKERIEE